MAERIFGDEVIERKKICGCNCSIVKENAHPMEFIVRCKDCSHFESGTTDDGAVSCWCDYWENGVEPNGFCYVGEKKE